MFLDQIIGQHVLFLLVEWKPSMSCVLAARAQYTIDIQPTFTYCSLTYSHLMFGHYMTKKSLTDHQQTIDISLKDFSVIHSFVSSQIDYCNSLLYGVPKCHIGKSQRVQNAAARLVVMQGKFCHITPVLNQLHWLASSLILY